MKRILFTLGIMMVLCLMSCEKGDEVTPSSSKKEDPIECYTCTLKKETWHSSGGSHTYKYWNEEFCGTLKEYNAYKSAHSKSNVVEYGMLNNYTINCTKN